MNLMPTELPVITRQITPPILDVWYWHHLCDLQAQIGWQDASKECLFADLSLGSWRGHWLAHQLAAQMDIPSPTKVQPELYSRASLQGEDAETIRLLIDNESEGDQNFITAYQFARSLIAAFKQQQRRFILVVAPVEHQLWGRENLQLLRLLATAAPSHGFRLGLLLRSDASLPELEDFRFEINNKPASPLNQEDSASLKYAEFSIPGILSANWLRSDLELPSEILRLADGSMLLSPNLRPPKPLVPGDVSSLPDELNVVFALQQQPQDVEFLQQQAGIRFAEGGYELAYFILEQIEQSSLSVLQKALIETQKQKIAIALMDFPRAAAGALPDTSLPDEVQASLYQSKAWGLVMTGQPAQAEPYFAKARQLLDPQYDPRLYLYLLNISALNQLRLGDSEAALAIEKSIEQQLALLPTPDWHLTYINCLNLARIYKKQRHFSKAEHYYRQGFSVNEQLRNESDLLYMNFCLAQLEALQERHQQALFYWLRTTLHWLSNPLPEALAPRVVQAILNRPLSNKESSPEQISASLLQSLRQCCQQLGLEVHSADHCIAFGRISDTGQAQQCIGLPGLSLLISREYSAPLPFDGDACRQLNQWVLGLLQLLLPQFELDGIRSVLTDQQYGVELPATARETLWSCLKWQVPELIFAGQRYDVPLEDKSATAITSSQHQLSHSALFNSFRVVHSKAISYVQNGPQGWQVVFKRYRPTLKLSSRQQVLLRYVQEERSLDQLCQFLQIAPEECLRQLYQLTEQRLIQVH
ncbi:hypothetical protein H0255_10110 [Pectobacterium versatile]|uniref:hypothetical protein n=1 Tax=Pectobacterium versatile TaxID=2488639 RepID=UPI0015DDFB8D|nr:MULTISPECIES: hypothetical protein [Pectobacterium]MBA0163492.1 hypothetical protein [Pectobacterium versatile]MBD0848079.1 hypothetical protein [Pectobacterium carotovorum subsp. carotovorum]MBK4824560.1 hypothetical protein [Pectobacterium carotovorum subsp. carotovorum]MBN3058240.1 hypothetical protein [Pectobacterium versatile]UNE78800.1 hypothetical protein IMY97_23415 [Pectobacterium versatile]